MVIIKEIQELTNINKKIISDSCLVKDEKTIDRLIKKAAKNGYSSLQIDYKMLYCTDDNLTKLLDKYREKGFKIEDNVFIKYVDVGFNSSPRSVHGIEIDWSEEDE